MGLNTERVALSTISLRHLPLAEALDETTALGFRRIDLGALPGVCDHVPFELDGAAVESVIATVTASGVDVVSVNADIGDLNAPLDADGRRRRDEHRDRLLALATGIGATALVLPNGRSDHAPIVDDDVDRRRVADELTRASDAARAAGIELWVEAPHVHRLAYDLDRAAALFALLPAEIGAVLDVSHIVASGSDPRSFLAFAGDRLAHVHLRDAEPGYIHHSIGRGTVDFPDLVRMLTEAGYRGAFALELETRDLDDDARGAEALRAGRYISDLLATTSDPLRNASTISAER